MEDCCPSKARKCVMRKRKPFEDDHKCLAHSLVYNPQRFAINVVSLM